MAGSPIIVLGEEVVLRTNDLALEIRRECGVIFGKACEKRDS